jgi:hypothetical protein
LDGTVPSLLARPSAGPAQQATIQPRTVVAMWLVVLDALTRALMACASIATIIAGALAAATLAGVHITLLLVLSAKDDGGLTFVRRYLMSFDVVLP